MMPQKSPYRTLFAVYFLAVLAGVFEFFSGSSRQDRDPDIYSDPVRNFPEAIGRLYPGSPEAEYLLGRRYEAISGRKILNSDVQRNSRSLPAVMSEMNADLQEAARHYERAIGMGLKSEESLYYNYALTLMRIQADPARIDHAIADWRRNFPYSTRRDLNERRRAIEQQLQQLPSFAKAAGGETYSQDSGAGSETKAALEAVPEWKTNSEYIGSQACGQCHQKEFDGYLETNHARALSEVHPSDEPPDAMFDHAASGRRYRVLRRDGALIIEESLPLDDGTEFSLTSTPVRYRVGSGHFARTYLRDVGGGFLFESPVTWYEPARAWGMTPGFDKPAHRSFSRQILENCLSCHSGQVCRSTESSFRLQIVENSIGCERCHGPGEAHVRFRQSPSALVAADDPIVNPQRLTRKLAESVCRQCHLQGDIHIGGRNVRAVDYRPGEALEKFSTVYRVRKRETDMTVVGHVEQLSESACYRKSETLTCTTCHNPHRAVEADRRIEHYRSVCMECHANQGCKVDLSTREMNSKNDCVHCHMPKSATEVPHLAFTHHHIGIHPLKVESEPEANEGLLVPLSDLSALSEAERERSLKLAQLQLILNRGPDFLASARGQELSVEVNKWLQNLAADGFDAETDFAKTLFQFVRGDQSAAEASAAGLLARNDLRSEEEAAVLERLAQIEFQCGRFEQARLHFGKLARIRCQGRDWFYLGLCEDRCGDSLAAVRALERARELEPASVEIYEALVMIQHGRKEFTEEQQWRDKIGRLKRSTSPTVIRTKP